MEKLRISLPVIVEGKYDKIRLSGILDAAIITTAGFGVFNHAETRALIRTLAAPGGVIVLTDSDGAGKLIRAKISSMLPKEKVIHLYTPQIPGKERRKSAPSKAGFLGVEGIDDDTLRALFAPFAGEGPSREVGGITKVDLFTLGLTGSDGASEKRDRLCAGLGLPAGMTPNALLSAVNILFGRADFLALAEEKLNKNENETTGETL
ncbi:MAG: DUF4093 domain-containing protein [Clostridia bacterium]|nr:DUF4093 domain-containing protein [Clostridia bacterium]